MYGGRLHLHDVITCYLDLDCGLVSFQKNDEFLGLIFHSFVRSDELFLVGFPHLSKILLSDEFLIRYDSHNTRISDTGTAFKLDKRAKENPFLPHICVKNTEVKELFN